jgi:hypothetical protein
VVDNLRNRIAADKTPICSITAIKGPCSATANLIGHFEQSILLEDATDPGMELLLVDSKGGVSEYTGLGASSWLMDKGIQKTR